VDAVAGMCHAVAADELNERFGPVNPRAAVKVRDVVDEYAAKFIGRAPFMVVATASADGACDASPKGGRPGFVQVVDPKTLVIPDYKGKPLLTPSVPSSSGMEAVIS
jgi:predicted pyridoxine 5'-phosphate oxidase superfamily flavin-nucleotide-binding protein